MKKAAKRLAIGASAAAAGALAVYGATSLLADVAMKRELPNLPRTGDGARLTGEAPNDAYRAAQREAAQRLASAPCETVSIRSRDGLPILRTKRQFQTTDA